MVRKLLLQQFEESEEKVQRALNRPNIKRKMEKLRQKGLVTSHQWAILYPILEDDKIDFKQVDLPLYILLLRKIGNLGATLPTGGYDQWPRDTEQNTTSQLVRLKLLHEEMKDVTSISDDGNEFNQRWQTLERTLLALKYSKYAIDNLHTCCVEQEKNFSYYWYHVWNSPELHRNELLAFCILLLLLISVFDWWTNIVDALEVCINHVVWQWYKLKKIVLQ